MLTILRFFVEDIQDHRVGDDVCSDDESVADVSLLITLKGTLEVKVKWKGWNKKADITWEPEQNLK